jgi:photosystem II stability/assembly factor-like uncharacterized protein
MSTSCNLDRGRPVRSGFFYLMLVAVIGWALAPSLGCAKKPETVASTREAVVQLEDTGVYNGPSSDAVKSPWRRLGPGGGGAQYTPTIQPNDPDTALVTSDMTGTFLTRNGGASWTMINLEGATKSITFDPVVPTTIYAGTNAGMLLRSTNTGEKWSLVYPHPSTVTGQKYVGDHAELELYSTDASWIGPRSSIMAITVDPAAHDHLYIAASVPGGMKVLRSTDAGQSWADVCPLAGSTAFGGFVRLNIDPSSSVAQRRLLAFTTDDASIIDVGSQTVVSIRPPDLTSLTDAGMGLNPATGQPVLYLTSKFTYNSATASTFATGAFRSVDMGQTWEEMLVGLDTDYVPGTELTYQRIATSLTDASVVYMSSVETTDGGNFGIMKSTDLGATWSWTLKITDPQNKSLGWVEQDFNPDWAGSPFAMTVADTDPDVVYATDWGTTYRTTDGGASWENVYCDIHPDGTATSRGLDVSNSNAIVFDPFDPSHLALVNSSDIGLFVSNNSGASWKHAMTGVPEAWSNSVYALVFDPDVPGRAWSAWAGVHDLPRYRYIRQPYNVELSAGGTCKSNDGLATWQCEALGLPEKSVPTSLALDPTSPPGQRQLYTTVMGRGVFKSTDDGSTWVPKNNGFESNGLNDHLYTWQILRAPDGVLYTLIARSARPGTTSKTANQDVATVGALYRSTDGAETWEELPLPAGVVFPNALAIDPKTPSRLYLACWPQTLEPAHIDSHGGLYRSEDGGLSWTNVFDDKTHVYGVAVDPAHTKRVYITTFEGYVLRSNDRGATWARLGGFNFKWAKNPILDPFDPHGRIYITTFGGGVWYGPQTGVQSITPDILPFP